MSVVLIANMKGTIVTPEQVMRIITAVGPRLGYDYTDYPVFPAGRTDVCAIKHTAENGSTYGYDVIYLCWEEGGQIRHKEIANTSSSKDYLRIASVTAEGEVITVSYGSGGSYSGTPWKVDSAHRVS